MMHPGLVMAMILLGPPATAETRVVERVLAVAAGRPVLLSEVRAAQRVGGEGAGPALEALVDEILMYAEASRLPQARVSPEEEERALLGLRATLLARGDEGGGDEAALRRMARRQAVILKYVDFRFRPQVRVAEEDVQAALRAPGAAGEEEIRRALAAEDLDRRIEAWVVDLRRAAPVRYNAPSR
jgi:hypothetical protein